MLIIRPEQMTALRKAALADFRLRLYEDLSCVSSLRSGQPWTPDEIWSHVDQAIEGARRFHLTGEIDVARLARIFCTRLGGFDALGSLPKDALNILYAYGVDPSEKLRAFEDWIEANPAGVTHG